MEVTIRQAIEEDVNAILKIINHEIQHSTALYDYKERTYVQQLAWFKKKKVDQMPVIVAQLRNKVVGFGTYGIFRPWDAYQFSIEHSLYVNADNRGLGIGKKLLSELIQLARQNGYHTMIAGIDSSNEGSFHFHKQFGFQEIGTFREIGYKFDRWLDLRFLQLFLS